MKKVRKLPIPHKYKIKVIHNIMGDFNTTDASTLKKRKKDITRYYNGIVKANHSEQDDRNIDDIVNERVDSFYEALELYISTPRELIESVLREY